MTRKEIKEAIEEIEENVWDDEKAHELEDGLYQRFVCHVAKAKLGELSTMAKQILKTTKLRLR